MAVTRLTALLNIREVGERVFSDLAETWWMIGISLLGACILSFTWILLMRFLAGISPSPPPHTPTRQVLIILISEELWIIVFCEAHVTS